MASLSERFVTSPLLKTFPLLPIVLARAAVVSIGARISPHLCTGAELIFFHYCLSLSFENDEEGSIASSSKLYFALSSLVSSVPPVCSSEYVRQGNITFKCFFFDDALFSIHCVQG